MYKINLDLIKKRDAVYIKPSTEVILKIEDYELDGDIKFSFDQWENLDNEVKKGFGEPTYQELLDKINSLKNQLEERNDLIEQYEEHNDARMEKYFMSEGIL